MRNDRANAVKLRKQGKTYNQISDFLHIPKSTLSYWFSGKDFENIKMKIYKKSQIKWAKNISKYNTERSQEIWNKRRREQEKASNEIKKMGRRELLLVGSSLYWAEGYKKTKWAISFCNSDPEMIKIIMKFFREICDVPDKKFRLRLHIHRNIHETDAKKFWIRITNLSLKHFNKTQKVVSRSSRGIRPKNTLAYGTLHILVFDKNVVDKIKGWIAGLKKMC